LLANLEKTSSNRRASLWDNICLLTPRTLYLTSMTRPFFLERFRARLCWRWEFKSLHKKKMEHFGLLMLLPRLLLRCSTAHHHAQRPLSSASNDWQLYGLH
jgi:hypothetical protein